MKILIVSFTFPPNKDGVSEAAGAMALGFVDRGWNVTVLTEETRPKREFPTWQGVQIIPYTQIDGSGDDIQICGIDGRYADFLASPNWDVIVIHDYNRPLRLTIQTLRKISARTIMVSHGNAALVWVRTPRFPYGMGFLWRGVKTALRMPFWLRNLDRAVYLSERGDFHAFYDHLLAKASGYCGRRVIPNGVDPEERGTDALGFRSRHSIPTDSFLFLCVANYSQRKDQGFAARAFRRAAIPDSVLVFIGSEFNEHSRIFQERDSQTNGDSPPGTIIWLEKKTREETLNAFAACNVFVLSSSHEAQPIALLEAMREGKPWVARKAGCIASMEGGLCVKSVKDMTKAMIRLKTDTELRKRLAKEGLDAVSNRYNRANYTRSYCKLIEEVVADGKPA